MKLIDVSHEVEAGMITYPGLPGPVIRDFLTREESRKKFAGRAEFHVGKIEMVANTGTYLDSPFHRYEDGKDLTQLPLSSLANLPGMVVRVGKSRRAIGPDAFRGLELRGKAVLWHTGWDVYWRTDEYASGHPFLTRESAHLLVESGARLVGIDSLNIDDTADPTRPAHSLLLEADIPIVEHLCNLQLLPDSGFRFFAVPVKVKNFGSFPVRAFAVIGA